MILDREYMVSIIIVHCLDDMSVLLLLLTTVRPCQVGQYIGTITIELDYYGGKSPQ